MSVAMAFATARIASGCDPRSLDHYMKAQNLSVAIENSGYKTRGG
jgi:hypothetical protein